MESGHDGNDLHIYELLFVFLASVSLLKLNHAACFLLPPLEVIARWSMIPVGSEQTAALGNNDRKKNPNKINVRLGLLK